MPLLDPRRDFIVFWNPFADLTEACKLFSAEVTLSYSSGWSDLARTKFIAFYEVIHVDELSAQSTADVEIHSTVYVRPSGSLDKGYQVWSACLQEGIVLVDTAKKLVSNGIDGGVFLTLTEGDFLELPFNFGERKKLQSLISMAVKEVSAKSQGFFYPYSLTRLAVFFCL